MSDFDSESLSPDPMPDKFPVNIDETQFEVLEEHIQELIELGERYGMTDGEIDSVLSKILTEREKKAKLSLARRRFKIIK